MPSAGESLSHRGSPIRHRPCKCYSVTRSPSPLTHKNQTVTRSHNSTPFIKHSITHLTLL